MAAVDVPHQWPRDLVETEADPRDVAPPWADHVQGIAHGPGHWFVTQTDRIWRAPMTLELTDADADHPGVRTASIPDAGIDHLGDCDFYDGFLFVAMEGTNPPRVGVFDLELEFQLSVPVPRQQSTDVSVANPWCAVNPRDGLIYSSRFRTDTLHAYRLPVGAEADELEHVRDVPLRDEHGRRLQIERVQGGTFTRCGHLYLTSDTRQGGLMGIDPATGRRHLHRVLPFEADAPEEEVIEGVTAIDLSERIPWMNGVVHVLTFDDRAGRPDYVWLRHFDVIDGADRTHF